MVTFGVGFGVTGSIQPEDAWAALEKKTAIAWPDPTSSEPAKLDDLLHAAVNSRGGFFSGSDPETFAQRIFDVLKDITTRGVGTAAAIATNSTRVLDDTLIYQARFDSEDWSGQIRAYKINYDGTIGDLYWDTDDKIVAHGGRKLYTWHPVDKKGVSLTWDSLSTAQQDALKGTDLEDKPGDSAEDRAKMRLNWIRGDRSKETPSGPLRKRSVLLGDIVNSDPLVVGAPNFGYDKLPSGTAGQSSYAVFREENKSRKKMLYVGSNDGMLHAFDAETGDEEFAYVPNLIFSGLKSLTDPAYIHRYFVDGPPAVGDAYLDDGWKTILVGTLGGGGKGIFALDITDPDTFKVLWEFTDADLGYVMGPPVIGRMKDGSWAVVLGNGYEGGSKKAALFVVKLSDGSLLKKIETPAGSSTSPNGLSPVTLLADADRTITHAYGGDLLGNLWKFDLSGNLNNWDVAYKTGSTSVPLFRAMAAGVLQPITAPPEIGSHPDGGYMVYFGTGKYFETGDNQSSPTSPVQSFYGIWDKSGNNTQITKTDRSDLQEQTITHEQAFGTEENLRVISNNAVSWSTKRGWFLDLKSPVTGLGTQGERVVSIPLLRHGRVIFTTLIPSTDPCDPGGSSWLMEMTALTGGRPTKAVFDVNRDKDVDKSDLVEITVDGKKVMVAASGLKSRVGIIKTPAVVSAGTLEYRYSGGSLGDIMGVPGAGSEDERLGRRSWREIIGR
jgi:type IV pilus assembly protein PilY1